MIDYEFVKKHFPQIITPYKGEIITYLDSAASTLKCIDVANCMQKYYAHEASNIHRGIHTLSEDGTTRYEDSRLAMQKFLGAKHVHEIIFTKGTTESINLVAKTWGLSFLKPGDEILISTMEHHSNIVPWQLILEQTGAKLKVIPIDDNGDILIEEYKKLLTNKVKIVSVVLVSNALGTINPIQEMIKLAHDNSSLFMVDAAQASAHIPIDVQELDCDFLALSAHKMFGPTGVGILYGKEALLDRMPPFLGGGDMIDKVTFAKTTFNKLPHKFEAGTPHIAGGICLKSAIDLINNIGLDAIAAHEHELLEYGTHELQKIPGLKIIGQAKQKASVISFVMDGLHPHDIGTLTTKDHIAIRTGHHCTQPLMERLGIPATARASFSIYNTKNDIDLLVKSLTKIHELFS